MKFTVFYRNNPQEREAVVKAIMENLGRGTDLSKSRYQDGRIQIEPSWPPLKDLNNVPLGIQAEYFEYTEAKELKTYRLLIIDVESIKVEESKTNEVAKQ